MSDKGSAQKLMPPPDFVPQALLDQAVHLRLARGESLFKEGDPVRNIYFVQSGEIKAVRVQPDGAQSTMIRSRAGEFFGESSVAVQYYSCHAMAVKSAHLLAFSVDAFRQALLHDGQFAFDFAVTMAAHARRQCSRQERLRLKLARDRVLHFLICEGGTACTVTWPASMSELAEELGLEPETLYRTLASLEQEGLIKREKPCIHLIRRNEP